MTGVLIRRGTWDTVTQQEDHVRYKEKMAIDTAKRTTSAETQPADALTLGFQLPEL